jgi:hypothetical protein
LKKINQQYRDLIKFRNPSSLACGCLLIYMLNIIAGLCVGMVIYDVLLIAIKVCFFSTVSRKLKNIIVFNYMGKSSLRE